MLEKILFNPVLWIVLTMMLFILVWGYVFIRICTPPSADQQDKPDGDRLR